MSRVNRKDIKELAKEVLSLARKAGKEPNAYPYLPEIISSIEAMLIEIALRKNDGDRERRVKMAGALERLITEDVPFSESPLGKRLLKFAEEFTHRRN